jgi:hypothetical protein
MTLEKLEALLAEWKTAEPQDVPLTDLRTDPALQPRAIECVGFAQANAEDRRSRDHVVILAHRMASRGVELEPLLVLRTDEGLVVFDGHHRLAAYRAAGRDCAPARIRVAEWQSAVAASKLVNIGGEKLGMHVDQRRDAAWQLLAQLTDKGRHALPPGNSQRGVADLFGIAAGTVNGMVKRLRRRDIEPDSYKSDHRDPGTGWPRWQYARNPRYGDSGQPLRPDQRWQQEVRKLARKLAEAADKHGPGIIRDAVAALREHGMDADEIDDLAHLADEIDPADSDY